MTFSKSQFSASTQILDTRYRYPKNWNNNLFFLFIDQLNYVWSYYFVELETIKSKIDTFFSNLFMKSITKKLIYLYIDK